MIFILRPFFLSLFLLFLSFLVSLLLLMKFSSVWVFSIIILVFSSGMMVLINYVSSIGSLFFSSYNYFWLFMSLPWVIFFSLFYSSDFSIDYSFKEFSSGYSLYFIIFFLMISMLFIMENCFSPSTPMQSSF